MQCQCLWRGTAMTNFLEFQLETSPSKNVPRHQQTIARYLDSFATNEIENLMSLCPIQHGKSFQCANRFPAYCLGRNPRSHILVTAYGATLCGRAMTANQRIIQSEYYQQEDGWKIGDRCTQGELLLDV